MANTIELFKKYIDKIDDVYKKASVTADLDEDQGLAREGANANEFVIPMLSMSGLSDYDRNSGYKSGDVTLNYETIKANYDRGIKFDIDAMDNEETAGVAFGKTVSEFERTQATPEGDAFTFATLLSKEGVSTGTAKTLATGEEWLNEITTATSKMDEEEVPEEGRILYITPTGYNAIISLDTTKSKEILNGFTKIVKVPQARFNSQITLGDKSWTATGQKLNFMIVQKNAVIKYVKHKVTKVIAPEQNQNSDGYLFFYRSYMVVDVYKNKLAGIYVSAQPNE